MHEWMRAVHRPTSYRVGNTKFSIKPQFQLLIMACCAVFIIVYILLVFTTDTPPSSNKPKHFENNNDRLNDYNSTYPLSRIKHTSQYKEYKIALIADLDTDSKLDHHKYVSYLLYGALYVYNDRKQARLSMSIDAHELQSSWNYQDRGMELSELIVFNGHLYTCDDRTGIVYEVHLPDVKVTPWAILIDGDGVSTSKGFKCEWMSVKNNMLYVGSLGKEWTTSTGELVNHNPQWIKVIDQYGRIEHVDWTSNYEKMRKTTGYSYPGYLIFEAGVWNHDLQKWYFLPRRASHESYDEKLDEQRATNILIEADEYFMKIDHRTIDVINPIRGYSSFKFIPETDNTLIVAIKSEEDSGRISTYLTVFNAQTGYILLKDTLISDKFKYEGIEFI